MSPDRFSRLLACSGMALGALVFGACRQDMHDQPKYEPLEQSTMFADGRSAREPVEGTVAREPDDLREDAHLYTGKVDGALADTFPFAITREAMLRGQQQYNVFCSPCHAYTGNGDGMIVRRGYRRPPSLHDERLRQAPPGHFFDVMTNGFGAMPDYAAQVSVPDRWAITAYIRALQLSGRASEADVPAADRPRLEPGASQPAPPEAPQ